MPRQLGVTELAQQINVFSNHTVELPLELCEDRAFTSTRPWNKFAANYEKRLRDSGAGPVTPGRGGKTMKSKWLLFAIGWIIILAGSLLAYVTETTNGIASRTSDSRAAKGNTHERLALHSGQRNGARPSPAPGILAVHGYINSRETQGRICD